MPMHADLLDAAWDDAGAAYELGMDTETAGFFDDVASSFKKVRKAVGKVTKKIAPALDIAQAGLSFVPGVGTAVSAAMAGARGLAEGKSPQQIALEVAASALPGGKLAQAALGAAKGGLGAAMKGDWRGALAGAAGGGLGGALGGGALGGLAGGAAQQLMGGALGAGGRPRIPIPRATAQTVYGAARPMGRRDPVLLDRIARSRAGAPRLGLMDPAAARVARALLHRPSLRGLPATALAARLGVGSASALDGMAAVIEAAKKQSGIGTASLVDAPSDVLQMIGGSLDDEIGAIGRPRMPVSSSRLALARAVVPRSYIRPRKMTKQGFARLLAHVPALRKASKRILTMVAGLGIQGSEASGIDPAFPGIYIVEPGDFPFKIAQKITGNGARWPELVAANSPPKSKAPDGNFKFLSAGEKLILPQSWVTAPVLVPTPAPGIPPTATPLPSPGQFPSSPGVARIYTVLAGDFPAKIAGLLTGNQGRWPELVAANSPPKKKAANGNFATLFAGEKLVVPMDWPPHPMAVPVGGVPSLPPGIPAPPPGVPVPPGVPAPPPPGAPPSVTIPGIGTIPLPSGFPMPPGFPAPTPAPTPSTPAAPVPDMATIAQAQAQLAAWNKLEPGKCNPADYGQNVAEFTGVWNARTQSALASFQAHHNAVKGSSLRTDGTLDVPTFQALNAYVGGLIAKAPPGAPAPGVPGAPGVPFPGAPGAPPGVPGAPAPKKEDGVGPLLIAGVAIYALSEML